MSEKINIKKMKQEVKNEKRNKTMSVNKTVTITIALTLIVLGALAGMFLLGINYQKGFNNQVHAEAKALSTELSSGALKQ